MPEFPTTLVRVGRYDSSLEAAVRSFHVALEPLSPRPFGNTIKYAAFHHTDRYLLIVSQQKDRILSPAGYNAILSVTSRSDALNESIADRFEHETGMRLQGSVPPWLYATMQGINLTFLVFEREPAFAMSVLKGLLKRD